eukprot:jgi/Phyca11/98579/e_gw1.3.924.1
MATSSSSSQPQMVKKPLVSIFDWDDTLCPTTWLHLRGLLVAHGLIDGAPSMDIETFEHKPSPSPLTSTDRKQLQNLELQVLQLLQLAARFGPVFIVTAASLPWVVASAEHFLPKVRQFLLDNQSQSGETERVQVVSARDWYHHQVGTGGSQLQWKCATFEALCSHLKVQEVFGRLKTRTDLISIGDARFEQKACVRMELKAGDFVRSKTIKFLDQPTLEELLEQLQMVYKMFDPMCQYDCGLHLCVSRKDFGNFHNMFGNAGRIVEITLDTLLLVQVDCQTALEGPKATDNDARLQQLLAAADSLTHKSHYASHGLSDSQNESPLAAVPGIRS